MHPVDRRDLACHMHTILKSMRKVALLLKVSPASVCRWLKHPVRKPYARRTASKAEQVVETLRACVKANPLVTLADMVGVVRTIHSFPVSKELVRTVLARSGFSRKRARFYGKPPDLAAKTEAFVSSRDRFVREGRPFASLDETAFGRNSGAIVKGYGPRGQPLRLERKPARVTTSSVLAAACSDGTFLTERRTGSFNTETFARFVQGLPLPRGTVLLLDNVAFHHAAAVRAAAEARAFDLLFVPPYSPWFNPVETAFSVVKRHYYAHHDAQAALGAVTPAHIKAAFRHSFDICCHR